MFEYQRAGCFSSIYMTIMPRKHEIIYPLYPRAPPDLPALQTSRGKLGTRVQVAVCILMCISRSIFFRANSALLAQRSRP
jgi:hypothetical protein